VLTWPKSDNPSTKSNDNVEKTPNPIWSQGSAL
jgi:hypothetical protein